jgi:hypothetical protein
MLEMHVVYLYIELSVYTRNSIGANMISFMDFAWLCHFKAGDQKIPVCGCQIIITLINILPRVS